MKFLKALATPFVKLWNWIKQTAWVQPLLIVGCIFAVIFSIPYIAKGVENLNKGSEDKMAYYKKDSNLISLKKANDKESEADDFFNKFLLAEVEFNKENGDQEVINNFTKTYGEKFFFTFVGTECDACHTNVKAFEELQKNAKDYYNLDGEFNFHSLIIDEDVGDKDKYKEKSAFEYVVENNVAFFGNSVYKSGITNYWSRNLDDNTDYMKRITDIAQTIKTVEVPIIMVIDTTETNKTGNMISQIFFDIPGDTDIKKATSLKDAWNYTAKTKFGPKEI